MLSLITPPAREPISVEQAKQHIRADNNDEDALLRRHIVAARQYAENFTRRAFVTQTWELRMDSFPPAREFELPNAPLQSVSGITYLDTAGVQHTWDASQYLIDAPSGPQASPGRVYLAYQVIYPITQFIQNAIAVTFTAGYGDKPDDVPAPIVDAMLLHIGHLYETRQPVAIGATAMEIPRTIEDLLWPFVVT